MNKKALFPMWDGKLLLVVHVFLKSDTVILRFFMSIFHLFPCNSSFFSFISMMPIIEAEIIGIMIFHLKLIYDVIKQKKHPSCR